MIVIKSYRSKHSELLPAQFDVQLDEWQKGMEPCVRLLAREDDEGPW